MLMILGDPLIFLASATSRSGSMVLGVSLDCYGVDCHEIWFKYQLNILLCTVDDGTNSAAFYSQCSLVVTN